MLDCSRLLQIGSHMEVRHSLLSYGLLVLLTTYMNEYLIESLAMQGT